MSDNLSPQQIEDRKTLRQLFMVMGIFLVATIIMAVVVNSVF